MTLKTDKQIQATKLPKGKPKVKHAVGEGLVLVITPSGKYWLYPFVFGGKRREFRIGVYRPGSARHVTLRQARSLAQQAKDMISHGTDPSQAKQAARQANIEAAKQKQKEANNDQNTFEAVARQWFAIHKTEWVPSHATRQLRRMERHIFTKIGDVPITELTKKQVSDTLVAIAETGSHDIAHRVAQLARSVLLYACDRGILEAVPMGNMKSLLPTPTTKPMPAVLDPAKIGDLLRAIDGYSGSFVVCQALKLLPLLAVRSGEFRQAGWSEFDLGQALWAIPAAHRKLKLKAKADISNIHSVPLSRQAVALLRELHQFTGQGKHVFPSVRGDTRPMSENTINAALATLGYKSLMVGHGWRSVFSTVMNEAGHNPDAIEAQLSHKERDAVRRAYNRSEYLIERVKIMQAWSDYLLALKQGADVIPIRQGLKK